MLRGGAPCGCCAQRFENLSNLRAFFLAEIAKLPRMAMAYAEFARGVRPLSLEAEDEETVTPEQTLAGAGIDSGHQAAYQRRTWSLLAGRA
jgi:hypothetical protein